MEHTAVQLMSRKQRAAKLLTGETGLTGLDAITEGESGFEEALLDALAKDEALLDPSELFTSGATSALDAEDVAYWNVDLGSTDTEPETTDVEPAALPAPEPSQPPTKRRRRKLDRMAVPDDGPREAGADQVPFVPLPAPEGTPRQLTLF